MLTIVKIEGREDGFHGLQSQSGRTACWEEGWIAVPENLAQDLWQTGGYCDLEIQDGVLTGFTPRERPAAPEPEPTEEETLRADVDYIALMTGVDLTV